MPTAFSDWIKKIKASGDSASHVTPQIKNSIRIVVEHWAEKKRLELDWIANNEELIEKETFLNNIENLLIAEIKKHKSVIRTFPEFKQVILEVALEELHEKFQNFYQLLVDYHEKAWKILDQILQHKISCFLKYHKVADAAISKEIYHDMMKDFSVHTKNPMLSFADSSSLKSYMYLMILSRIKNKTGNQIYPAGADEDNETLSLSLPIYYNPYPDSDYAVSLFSQLEYWEQKILYGIFLEQYPEQYLAQEFHLSLKNFSLIKFRLINKIRKLLKDGPF